MHERAETLLRLAPISSAVFRSPLYSRTSNFFSVGVVPRDSSANFFDVKSGDHRGVGREVNVGDQRHVDLRDCFKSALRIAARFSASVESTER